MDRKTPERETVTASIAATGHSLALLRRLTSGYSLTYHEHTHALYDVRTSLGPGVKTFVEIGGFIGATAALMLNHPLVTSVVTIDPLEQPMTDFDGDRSQLDTFLANVEASNVLGRSFRLIRAPSETATDALGTDGIDMLFIDGDHSFQAVTEDFRNYAPKVKAGGYVIFDDYLDKGYNPDVRPAVDAVVAQCLNGLYSRTVIKANADAKPSIGASNLFVLRKNRDG